MSETEINDAIVGLDFGADGITLRQQQPRTHCLVFRRCIEETLEAVGDSFGADVRHMDFPTRVKNRNVDAVHLDSPSPDRARTSLAALEGSAILKLPPFAL